MRYHSAGDMTLLRRRAVGPAALMARRNQRPMSMPRGSVSRFGALTSPAGQGAGSGAAIGASEGASIGSAVPVIGTAVGAAIGAIVGAITGAIGKKDPETNNFQAAINAYNQGGPNAVYNIGNKYLVLAGLFDLNLHSNVNIPIYKKYGRMGEQRFVNDLMGVIQQAGNAGIITQNDTPQSVMAKVVQPWIDSFGFGAMNDPNANMINALLLGMVAEFVMGGTGLWTDVNGGAPFASVHFSLPNTAANRPVTSPQIQQPAPAAPVTVTQQPVFALPPPVPAYAPQPGVVGGNGGVTFTAPPVINQPVALTAPAPVPAGPPSGLPAGYAVAGISDDGRVLAGPGGQQVPPLLALTNGAWIPFTGTIGQSTDATTSATPVPAPSSPVYTGGGGGGYFPTPVSAAPASTPLYAPVASGLPDWVLPAGVAAVLVLLLARRKTI